MTTELQRAATLINASRTGSTAVVIGDHVSVHVPGIRTWGGGSEVFFSVECVRSVAAAHRLIDSMR